MTRIPLWIDLRDVPVKKRVPYLRACKAARAERILVAEDDTHADRDDAVVVDADGKLQNGEADIGRLVELASGDEQEAAAQVEGTVIVDAKDWKVIPLENLIAARRQQPGTLFALARSPEQAGLFRDTLEVGVHGIVLAPQDALDIEKADGLLREKGIPVLVADEVRTGDFLVSATVDTIADAGPGDRVCVDATSAFEDGEGLLVGSTARSFVLVHAETIETEYVNARPFRVNAGAIHSYLLGPDSKTQYLSEVEAGSHILAVTHDGSYRALTVGRAKIERRPHLLIRWTTEDGQSGSAVLQNAETIRLVRPGGEAVGVNELKEGDEILVHTEAAARHFGMPVDEKLEER